MKTINKKILTLFMALALIAAIPISLIRPGSINANAATIEAPEFYLDEVTRYNVVNKYGWDAPRNHYIALSPFATYGGNYEFTVRTSRVFEEYAWADALYMSYMASPYYKIGKSYNPATNQFSSGYTSIEMEILHNGNLIVIYGRKTKYEAVGQLKYGLMLHQNYVPTTPGDSKFTMSHKSSPGHMIRGTIHLTSYYDAYVDVDVPISATPTDHDIVIEDVCFKLRVDATTCSLYAVTLTIRETEVKFAFGVD